MNNLVAIDPGTRYLAYAIVLHGRLAEVGKEVLPAQGLADRCRQARHAVRCMVGEAMPLVIEHPIIRPGFRAAHQDVIDLATIVGACCSSTRHAVLVQPQRWKGSVPKDKHQARMRKTLPPDWVRHMGKDADINDAIGIAYWAMTRLEE